MQNVEDVIAGIVASPTSGTTSERGEQALFSVRLGYQPTGNVIVKTQSLDNSEGRIDNSTAVKTLNFTKDNWNGLQTVTVDGQDDNATDGTVSYSIKLWADNSSADTYNESITAYVFLKNIDDESAGFRVSSISGHTSESGGRAFFTVRLTSAPSDNVTIGASISGDDATEGEVSPASLTFTTTTWNAAQTMTVTGKDDYLRDNATAYTVTLTKDTTTSDLNYRNLDPPDVLVVNDDDEIPGLKVSAASGATTETKGTAFFTVKLLSKPSSTVRLNLSSSGTSEGRVTAISGSSVNIVSTGTSYLEFSTTDWNSERSVTVTGQDDSVTDGNQAYAVTVWVDQANTADSGYDPLDNVTVLLSNVDDETSGFLVSGISGTVSEKQTSANFSVRLTSQPNGSVIFKAASDNTSEGSVSPSTHTFSSSNWSGEQAFTVTGVDDSVNDGDQAFRIVLTVDNNSGNTTDTSGYRLLNPPDVWVTNVDDETPGFYHTLPSGPTSEDNGTAVFTVGLQTQPTGNVVLDLGISDKTEGTFTSGSTDNDTQLSFTTVNWNAPQTVTVWGLDDNDTDGTQGYTVTLAVNTASTLDADYDKLSSRMLSLSNTDDETAGFLVSVPSGSTSESGDNATFTVRLSSAPITGLQVMLDLSSSDTNEGRITAASAGSPSINSTGTSTLTFTSSTWNTPVTVTVTGQNDSSATRDGDQRYRINLSVNSASTTASEYRLLDPADVALVNTDDDQAGLRVSAPSTAELSESGDNATFTVTLNTAPTQTVTVPIYSSDPTEAKLIVNGGSAVDSDNLSFAPGTTGPKTITVVAQNDTLTDGDQPVRVILSETSSSDANYHGLNPQDLGFVNADNDTVAAYGFLITNPTNSAKVQESDPSTKSTFTVALTSAPAANVDINLYSSDSTEATVSPTSLQFTSSSWSAKTVTVTAVNDSDNDSDQFFQVILLPATSSDGNYNGKDPQDLGFVNQDDD